MLLAVMGWGTGTWSAICLEEVMTEQTVLGIRRKRERPLYGAGRCETAGAGREEGAGLD